MQIHTAGLLLIRDRKLLLAYSRNKQCYYLPGGKIDAGENARQALCREVKEELNMELGEDELIYYTHITAPAFGERNGLIMEQDCFITHTAAEPTPTSEIAALKYFSLQQYRRELRQAPGAVLILQQLEKDNLIDP